MGSQSTTLPRALAAAVVLLVSLCMGATTTTIVPAAGAAASASAPGPADPAGPAGPAGSVRPAEIVPQAASALPLAARSRPPRFPSTCASGYTICRLTTFPGRPWVVLMGDSHALQYYLPMKALAQSRRVNLLVSFAGGCPLSVPFPASSGEPRLTCDKHNAKALRTVRRLAASGRTVRVVLGSWWDYYRTVHRTGQTVYQGHVVPATAYTRHITRLGAQRSAAFFAAIGRAGIPADVIAQSGTLPLALPACPEGTNPYVCSLPRSKVMPREAGNRRFLARLSRGLANRPVVIDPSPVYCTRSSCAGRVGAVATYADSAHLSQRLTPKMRPYFRATFRAVEAQHRRRR